MIPTVSVIALNYKQKNYLKACLDAVLQQTYPCLEILFIDNASLDGSVDFVRSYYPDIKVIENKENLFFSKAYNQAIRETNGDYIMPLNVDLVMTHTYIEEMVKAIELSPEVGMVSGKLLKMDKEFHPVEPAIIDSTGLWFTPQMRHFDRGSLEVDRGQYNQIEYIFGPSGAAPLYRRKMLEDIAYRGEYFDEDFVIYREDADLAWRAQLYSWKCIYMPFAVAYHLRRVQPTDNRKTTSPVLNMHSVKNRFLLRLKNQTIQGAFHCFFPSLIRDLQVFGYVALFEHSSIPAFLELVRVLPRIIDKRRVIMGNKRVSDQYINQWFSHRPVSIPYLS